jgi:hypothetical protein
MCRILMHNGNPGVARFPGPQSQLGPRGPLRRRAAAGMCTGRPATGLRRPPSGGRWARTAHAPCGGAAAAGPYAWDTPRALLPRRPPAQPQRRKGPAPAWRPHTVGLKAALVREGSHAAGAQPARLARLRSAWCCRFACHCAPPAQAALAPRQATLRAPVHGTAYRRRARRCPFSTVRADLKLRSAYRLTLRA